MANGRKTGGRSKGTPNKRTTEVRDAAAATLRAAQAAADPDTLFHGDAHALMVLVYQNESLPLDMRLDAAAKAIKSEKPALAAVEVTKTTKRSLADFTTDELLALAADHLQGAGKPKAGDGVLPGVH